MNLFDKAKDIYKKYAKVQERIVYLNGVAEENKLLLGEMKSLTEDVTDNLVRQEAHSFINYQENMLDTVAQKFEELNKKSAYIDMNMESIEPFVKDVTDGNLGALPLIPVASVVAVSGVVFSMLNFLTTVLDPQNALIKKHLDLINAFIKGEITNTQYTTASKQITESLSATMTPVEKVTGVDPNKVVLWAVAIGVGYFGLYKTGILHKAFGFVGKTFRKFAGI